MDQLRQALGDDKLSYCGNLGADANLFGRRPGRRPVFWRAGCPPEPPPGSWAVFRGCGPLRSRRGGGTRLPSRSPALQMGQYSTEGITGGMAFKRRYTSGGTDGFALVTVSDGAVYTGIPNGTYTDAVTGDTRTVSDGRLTVAAPGKGNLRVYVLGGTGKIGTAGPLPEAEASPCRRGSERFAPAAVASRETAA